MLELKLAAAERKVRRLERENRTLTTSLHQLQNDVRAITSGGAAAAWRRVEDAEKRASEAAARLFDMSNLVKEQNRSYLRLQKRHAKAGRELKELLPHDVIGGVLSRHWS